MNENHFSFIFLCAFLLGICLILPIAFMYTPPTTSPCGWADFDETVTDLQNDVVLLQKIRLKKRPRATQN